MLNILILDDSDKKIESVARVLEDSCGITKENIDIARNAAEGRRCLEIKHYDMLLLDLVLPLLDGDNPDENGGLSFLKQISGAGNLHMPTQIVGLTEKETAYEKELPLFQNMLFSVILRRQSENDWIVKLQQVVNYAQKSKDAILNSFKERYNYDIGVICALSDEFHQMMEAFGGSETWTSLRHKELPFEFMEKIITTASGNELKVIAAAACRPGVVPTSILSTIMYTTFHVKTLFMTGYTAGFQSDNLNLGDILIASTIEDYASGKLKDVDGCMKLLKEQHQINASHDLISQMENLLQDDSTQANLMRKIKKVNLQKSDRDLYIPKIVPTCCGPYVVSSEELVNELKENDRKLQGLDMEGYGLYMTSFLLTKDIKRKALWIKGVSDYANPQKNDDYHKTCAFSSATLLYMFIKEEM